MNKEQIIDKDTHFLPRSQFQLPRRNSCFSKSSEKHLRFSTQQKSSLEFLQELDQIMGKVESIQHEYLLNNDQLLSDEISSNKSDMSDKKQSPKQDMEVGQGQLSSQDAQKKVMQAKNFEEMIKIVKIFHGQFKNMNTEMEEIRQENLQLKKSNEIQESKLKEANELYAQLSDQMAQIQDQLLDKESENVDQLMKIQQLQIQKSKLQTLQAQLDQKEGQLKDKKLKLDQIMIQAKDIQEINFTLEQRNEILEQQKLELEQRLEWEVEVNRQFEEGLNSQYDDQPIEQCSEQITSEKKIDQSSQRESQQTLSSAAIRLMQKKFTLNNLDMDKVRAANQDTSELNSQQQQDMAYPKGVEYDELDHDDLESISSKSSVSFSEQKSHQVKKIQSQVIVQPTKNIINDDQKNNIIQAFVPEIQKLNPSSKNLDQVPFMINRTIPGTPQQLTTKTQNSQKNLDVQKFSSVSFFQQDENQKKQVKFKLDTDLTTNKPKHKRNSSFGFASPRVLETKLQKNFSPLKVQEAEKQDIKKSQFANINKICEAENEYDMDSETNLVSMASQFGGAFPEKKTQVPTPSLIEAVEEKSSYSEGRVTQKTKLQDKGKKEFFKLVVLSIVMNQPPFMLQRLYEKDWVEMYKRAERENVAFNNYFEWINADVNKCIYSYDDFIDLNDGIIHDSTDFQSQKIN